MRKVWYAALLAGLFLLMLSALVVTPEAPVPAEPVNSAAVLNAEFHPLVSALLPAAEAPHLPDDIKPAAITLTAAVVCACLFTGLRDANGRIVSASRYENSVYQLFRPEVAGG